MIRPAFLLVGWAIVTVGTFWQYKGRYLLPVAPTGPVPKLGQSEAMFKRSNQATLLVAWNLNCPCSQFEEDHLKKLARDWMPKGIRIIPLVVGPPQKGDEMLARWEKAGLPGPAVFDPYGRKAKQLGIAATPGAVILDGDGRIAYRGSLHAGRFCSDDNLAFAEQAIPQIVSGNKVTHPEIPFYGCALPFEARP